MFGINYIAILVMAVAAFVASSVYYVVFGNALAALLPAESVATDIRKVPAWKKAAEFVRGFVASFVVASLVEQFGVVDWKGALRLAVLVWIGFPFMILTGSVLWDNRPRKFAAIHSGDWLMKLVLMTVISGTWHR
jgi:tetrahydromethanopterin S-methyltransferase subunit D